MTRVVPCEPAHLYALASDSAPEEREITLEHIENTPGIDGLLAEHARSLIHDDGRVLACFGVWPHWPGVGRAWSDLTAESLREHPKALHRAVMEELAGEIERNEFRRVEAIVAADHEAGQRWMDHLGFQLEGVMSNYGVGGVGEFYLYARCAA